MTSYYDIFYIMSAGWVGIVSSDNGLTRSVLPMKSYEDAYRALHPQVVKAKLSIGSFKDLEKRLGNYFAGKSFDLPDILDLEEAPPFFKVAWEKCRTIPLGETRSYSWLAIQASSVKALRAAGQAMAKNPLPIIVPCHRVIGKNGSLTGFAGTIGLKQKMLDLDKRIVGRR
tara:strand:- start:1167 stop:1679 length:513 start_codon:yes stop_codon:yes gene_type:complete